MISNPTKTPNVNDQLPTTPRTDAFSGDWDSIDSTKCLNFARTLETELIAAQARIAELERALATSRAAVIEECAKVCEAAATCNCDGIAGYCMTNDPPRELAKSIRALLATPPSEGAARG